MTFDDLPIGSLVLLKDAKYYIMIMASPYVKDDKEYKYMGVFYPLGFTDDNTIAVFNSEDIKDVRFVGFDSEFRYQKKDYVDSKNL